MKFKKMIKKVWAMVQGKISNESLGFSCCFCSQSIMLLDKYPADLCITVNIDKPEDQQHDQFFFCHTDCFKNKLHHNIKPYFTLEQIKDIDD